MDTPAIPKPTALLLIDDDHELAALLRHLFEREGLTLHHAATGSAGLAAVASLSPTLVLLDLMLPDGSGIHFFRLLREQHRLLPVIMLTAKGDPVDRVVGLELGADDYVAKPFDPRELVARIRAVLRRTAPSAEPPTAALRLRFGAVEIDAGARTVSLADKSSTLTHIEFKLLTELAQHPGTPLSREALTRAVQSHNYRPLERAVDVQVARLRRKLRELDGNAAWILTARGQGYLWSPPAEPQR
jgi:DNA-binding response OmpR family regulator